MGMDGIPVVMTHIKMTVNAIQGVFTGSVEKMSVTAIDRQCNREKILVAFKARFLIDKMLRVFKQLLCFPVYFSAVLK
jgi:hypothetical protein